MHSLSNISQNFDAKMANITCCVAIKHYQRKKVWANLNIKAAMSVEQQSSLKPSHARQDIV